MEKKKVQTTSTQNQSFMIDPVYLKLAAVAVLLALVVLFPKPQRITYEYANMVSKGTYWDGLFGPGMLLDSNAKFVRLDEDTEHLHVCYSQENDNCLRYKVIDNSGFSGYVASWFSKE